MTPSNSNRWTTDPEYIELLNFLIKRTENVESCMNIQSLARDFKEKSGAPQLVNCLVQRIERVRTRIHSFEHIDTKTKVKMLFALSGSVNPEFLKELNKDGLVTFDKKNRIDQYKSNDGSFNLRRTKIKTIESESIRCLRSLIIDCFKNKNNADAIPKNNEVMEIWNLIEFIIEKCETIGSPLNILQLARDFIEHFGILRPPDTIAYRIRTYGQEIQKIELLDTPTKVKQLICLSATLDSDCLEKLRKYALVGVDEKNRITHYIANDGSLELRGDHSRLAKTKTTELESNRTYRKYGDHFEKSENKNIADAVSRNEEEIEIRNLIEFITKKYGTADSPLTIRQLAAIRIHPPKDMPIVDNFDFDPPTQSSHRSEEIEMRENEENDLVNTETTVIKARKLFKRSHSDSHFSYNLANCSSSGSSKYAKQKKIAIEKEQVSSSSNQSSIPSILSESEESMGNLDAPEGGDNPSDCHGPRIQEMDDCDYNPRKDNTPESSPIDNRLEEPEQTPVDKQNTNIEAQNTDDKADAFAPEPKPEKESLTLQNNKNCTPNTNGNGVVLIETPIKVEEEEPIKVENPPEDFKPEITHNFKIKFFNAMKSLILFLDDTSLSDLQSEIRQKIRNVKRSGEMISNDEMIPALELLVARMANHSVSNLSESVKSVSLIQFFSYLKASILNSKMIEGSHGESGKCSSCYAGYRRFLTLCYTFYCTS